MNKTIYKMVTQNARDQFITLYENMADAMEEAEKMQDQDEGGG